jgi:hypothetical protein
MSMSDITQEYLLGLTEQAMESLKAGFVKRYCELHDVDPEQVAGSRLYGPGGTYDEATLVLLIDYGVAGTKKYEVPVDAIPDRDPPEDDMSANSTGTVKVETSDPPQPEWVEELGKAVIKADSTEITGIGSMTAVRIRDAGIDTWEELEEAVRSGDLTYLVDGIGQGTVRKIEAYLQSRGGE